MTVNFNESLPDELQLAIFDPFVKNRLCCPRITEVCTSWYNLIKSERENYYKKTLGHYVVAAVPYGSDNKLRLTLCRVLSGGFDKNNQIRVETGLPNYEAHKPYLPIVNNEHSLSVPHILMVVPKEQHLKIDQTTLEDIGETGELISQADAIFGQLPQGEVSEVSGKAIATYEVLGNRISPQMQQEVPLHCLAELATAYFSLMINLRWALRLAYDIDSQNINSPISVVDHQGETTTATLPEWDTLVLSPLQKRLLDRLDQIKDYVVNPHLDSNFQEVILSPASLRKSEN